MIKVERIHKFFGDKEVLRGISFEIGVGEVVGFLGPNGAGKTTTMRIMSGYLSPDSGQALINGLSPMVSGCIRSKIGYLPENNPLYGEMTVAEYLTFVAKLKGVRREELKKKVAKAVYESGLEDVYYELIFALSKGFRQRVGLGASIIGDPDFLILDEPTEGLDPNQRIDIRNLIKSLGRERTVVVSSHVLSEIENTCQRAIIINDGRVVADGGVKEIIAGFQGSAKLLLEIEGEAVVEKIKALVGEEKVESINREGNHQFLSVLVDSKNEYRPQVNRLARENNWVIWRMERQQTTFEDVFRRLTLN